jgi:hypothetical protein
MSHQGQTLNRNKKFNATWSQQRVVGQCLIRKMLSNFCDYTLTTINILNFFSHKEKNDLLVRTSPFNQRVQGSILFFVF